MLPLRHPLLLLLFPISSSFAALVQGPPDSTQMGVPFTITFAQPLDTSYTYKLAKHDAWDGFTQILDTKEEKTESLYLITFSVAVYQAPLCTLSLPLLSKTPKDTSDTTLTKIEDTLPLVVVYIPSVFTDSTDTVVSAQQHAPFKAGKFPWKRVYTPLLITLLLGGIIGFFVRNYKRKTYIPAPIPLTPPYDEARQALIELQKKKFLTDGHSKLFVFLLSDILKRYLGREFQRALQESTSQEFLGWIQKSPLSRELQTVLENFITITEPIKFSGMEAPTSELKALYKAIEKLIDTVHTQQIAEALNILPTKEKV